MDERGERRAAERRLRHRPRILTLSLTLTLTLTLTPTLPLPLTLTLTRHRPRILREYAAEDERAARPPRPRAGRARALTLTPNP